MKHALPGALLLCLASTSVVAQVDCSAYTNAAGVEPPGYAMHCRGHGGSAHQATKVFKAALGDDAVTAYAIQMTEVGDSAATGLYEFAMPDFGSASVINGGEQWTTAGIRNLAFDPAGSRLHMIRTTVLGGLLGVLHPSVPRIQSTSSVFGPDPRIDQITGFTINPRNGQAWMTTNRSFTNNPPISESWLWRLDMSSGNAQYIGLLLPEERDTVMIDIAIDCSGQMYGHNISDDSLYHINTNDLTITRVGSHGLPANFAQGMDFDKRDGSLYAWIYTGAGDNQFGTLDLETGAFNALAQNSPRGEWIGAIPTRCSGMVMDDLTGMTGTWYDPVTSGQGFSLRYYPESGQVFMPWFTFMPAVEDDDDDDEEEPPSPDLALRWFAIEGEWTAGAGSMTAPIVANTGGRFNTGGGVQRIVVGEANLSFLSCDVAVLDYTFNAGELTGRSGSINLIRNLPLQADCRDYDGRNITVARPHDPAITGTWYDPNSSGQGLEISRIAQRDEEGDDPGDPGLLFASWFTYDPESTSEIPGETQHWLTLQGQSIDDDEPDVISSAIYLSLGGTFDEGPAFTQRQVGTATLESIACDRLKLTYKFEDSAMALDFRNLQGEIDLYRLGSCLPTPPED